MKPIFSKSRASLQYTYSGVPYSYILFLLVFFFIISFATLRDRAQLVKIELPDSTASTITLTHEEIKTYDYPWIYVGRPLDPIVCFPFTKPQIQVGDVLIPIEQIPQYLSDYQFRCPPVKKIAYLKIDK
ncbi:hypothetical protein GXP67_12710 [Rhodocytophaga rosea]|uniref:Uncharacterized protein n=1 Tax=Rhodocytophaga rosea TaxID=2704465 RepID=A0A6C0GHJ6_9BACT|nr:hypothetical protein [Rhodocytophaga rosea]QHT67429.1 hypothetical protein GXP67_12710 [Rhodocytophaga rosea]